MERVEISVNSRIYHEKHKIDRAEYDRVKKLFVPLDSACTIHVYHEAQKHIETGKPVDFVTGEHGRKLRAVRFCI